MKLIMVAIIVSAYYKIPSKRPHGFYRAMLFNFFTCLQGKPIVFFCEQQTCDEIKQFPVNTDNVRFEILEFTEIPLLKEYPYSLWKANMVLDPEKYHTPELGVMWASKKDLVKVASEKHPNADWYVWVDAGCIRTLEWKNYTEAFLQRALSKLSSGVYIQQLSPIPRKKFYRYPDTFIAGAIIAFHKDYINLFIDSYNETLKEYIENRVSITSDQYIMATMVSKYKFQWLHSIEPHQINCPDIWFYFIAYL